MSLRQFLPLLPLLLAAACASSASSPRSFDPPPAADFRPLVDVAAMEALLAGPALPLESGDSALVFFGYDGRGRRTRVGAGTPEADVQRNDSIRSLFLPIVPESGPSSVGAHVLLVGGTPASVQNLIPSDQQRPEIANSEELGAALRRASRIPDLIGRSIDVLLLIEVDGSVRDWQLQASSGSPAADIEMMQIAQTARFQPSRIDGIPVSSWVQFPLTIFDGSIRTVRQGVPPQTPGR